MSERDREKAIDELFVICATRMEERAEEHAIKARVVRSETERDYHLHLSRLYAAEGRQLRERRAQRGAA